MDNNRWRRRRRCEGTSVEMFQRQRTTSTPSPQKNGSHGISQKLKSGFGLQIIMNSLSASKLPIGTRPVKGGKSMRRSSSLRSTATFAPTQTCPTNRITARIWRWGQALIMLAMMLYGIKVRCFGCTADWEEKTLYRVVVICLCCLFVCYLFSLSSKSLVLEGALLLCEKLARPVVRLAGVVQVLRLLWGRGEIHYLSHFFLLWGKCYWGFPPTIEIFLFSDANA